MGLFKTFPITFIAMISYFSILGNEKKIIKLICIVCSFHSVKCALSNVYCYCFVVYFCVTWSQLVMFLYVNMNLDLHQIKRTLINKYIDSRNDINSLKLWRLVSTSNLLSSETTLQTFLLCLKGNVSQTFKISSCKKIY